MSLSSFLAILVVSMLVFAPSFGVGFLSDDWGIVRRIHEHGWFAGWNFDVGGFFRPVMVASLVVDHAAFGLDARGFHVVNVVLHGSCAWLVGIFVLEWLRGSGRADRRTLAAASALGFAVLSGHTEPVIWIACRSDLLATCFGLIGTICVLRVRCGALWGWGALVALAVAMFSKESALVWPLIWPVLLVLRPHVGGKLLSKSECIVCGMALATLALYLVVRTTVLGVFVGGYGTSRTLPTSVSEAVSNGARLLLRPLLPTLPFSLRQTPWRVVAIVVACLPLILRVATLRRATRADRRAIGGLVAGSLLSLIPVLGFHPTAFGSENERFSYLPSVFIVPFAFMCLADVLPSRAFRLAAVLVCAAHAVVLVRTERRWVEAGEFVDGAVAALRNLEPESTCVANLPDTVEGVHTLRNGLEAALFLSIGRDRSPFSVAATEKRMFGDQRVFRASAAEVVVEPIGRLEESGDTNDVNCTAVVDGATLRVSPSRDVRRVVVFANAGIGGVHIIDAALPRGSR